MVSAFVLGVSAAMAVPAKPGVKKMLTLKDGSRVEATLRGDEHVHFYEAADGRAFQMMEGQWQQVDRQELAQLHTERLQAANQRRAARRAPRRAGSASGNTYFGTRRGLVILVEFSDVKFTYDKATFNDYFNKVGFNLDGMRGSVHDYFLEQSYGKFDLEFDVVGPVKLSNTAQYYGYDQASKTSHDDRVAKMVGDVCKKVNDEVDFTTYDWNNDGTVDQVYVIYAGYGAAQGADHTIWPHEWSVRAAGQQPVVDGVRIDTYGISCELLGDGVHNTGHIDGVGTSCHEFSHCLGLPDFYDTSETGSNFGMNAWDLMDSGCYNGDSNGHSPSGYTAYERWWAGWLEPVELKGGQQIVDMPALQDEPVAYVVYNDANRNEYYLLENYQQKGFDTAGGGHGLLVLHVDYDTRLWASNTVNNEYERQRMTIIAADNVYTGNTVSGDPFPGNRKKKELTNTSTPKAVVYNTNIDGQNLMSKPISRISETAGLITFDFMGGVEVEIPVVHEPTAITTTGFTASWDAVDGAVDYTINLTKTITGDDQEAISLLDEDFENFRSSMQGTADLAYSLDEYTNMPGWSGARLYSSPNKLRVGKKNILGELLSPVFDAPVHDSITIFIAPISTASKIVNTVDTLQLRIYAPDMGGYLYVNLWGYPKPSDEDAGTAWYIPTEWPYGRLQLGVHPNSSTAGVYMDYLGLLDGSYDEEEESEAPAKALRKSKRLLKPAGCTMEWHSVGLTGDAALQHKARRAPRITSEVYTSTVNSYTFTNLEPAQYSFRVRANTANGVSDWSDEVSVELTDAIHSVTTGKTEYPDGSYFDLQGRRIVSPAKGLYIREGRKLVIK